MLNDPRDAPTLTISPSDDSSRVATACDTFSTCIGKYQQSQK